jgi:two-component system response regulator
MKRIKVLFFLTAFIGVSLLVLLDRNQVLNWRQKREVKLDMEATVIQVRLQNSVYSRIYAAHALKSLMELHPDTTEKEFRKFAESLMAFNPSLRALQVTDQKTQVLYVYPPEGNKITITHPMVLINDPLRGQFVKKAIKEKRMIIQPPFVLRQGGLGVVARQPIFVSGVFTGLVITVFDLPSIIKEAVPEIEKSEFIINLSIPGEEPFYNTIESAGPYKIRKIILADSIWNLRISYRDSSEFPPLLSRLIILGFTGGFLLILLLVIWFLTIHGEYLKKEVEKRVYELKQVNEDLNESQRIARVGSWRLDLVSNMVIWSHELYRMYGFDPTLPPPPYTEHQKLFTAEDWGLLSSALSKTVETGIPYELELETLRSDGSRGWMWVYGKIVTDDNNITVGLVGAAQDITDRKIADNKIRSLLAEKELLLKEVHHRIKNNMNAIKGLISLQLAVEKESSAISLLHDLECRVQSMILLYEKLYCSENYRELSVKNYLTTLAEDIISNFPNSGIVKINTEIDDFILNVKDLTPLGIIVNEILTNAMKYSFTGRESGIVILSGAMKDNKVQISIEDNGIGIPETVNFENSTGFGMQLISMLTEQINGSIRIERNNGTKYIINFPD